ncbi:MAG: lysophospholipid acyltransferase family protein [Actinomycetota bacterium]|nr:lysophospholipid acyltransferase family protein [Actinomycetota bacterium]
MENDNKDRSKLLFTIADYAFLFIFHLTRLMARILPASAMYLLANAFGYLLYYGRPFMHQRLLAKISESLPEISDQHEIALIGREACCSFFRPIIELFLFKKYEDRCMKNLQIEGMEFLDQAESESDGRGILMLLSHVGNFGLFPPIMARLDRPCPFITFSPLDTPVPRYTMAMGLLLWSLDCGPDPPGFFKDTIKQVRQHLNQGKRIGIGFDVEGNYVVEFMGKPAALASGIAHFAVDTGAPIVPAVLLRRAKPLMYTLKFYKPLTYDLTGDRKKDIGIIMREVIKAGERKIREAPDQYLNWFGLWHWWDKAKQLSKDTE